MLNNYSELTVIDSSKPYPVAICVPNDLLRLRGGSDAWNDPSSSNSGRTTSDSKDLTNNLNEQQQFVANDQLTSIQNEEEKKSDNLFSFNQSNELDSSVAKQLKKLNEVRESLYSLYGWGSDHVDQNSKWDVDVNVNNHGDVDGTKPWENFLPSSRVRNDGCEVEEGVDEGAMGYAANDEIASCFSENSPIMSKSASMSPVVLIQHQYQPQPVSQATSFDPPQLFSPLQSGTGHLMQPRQQQPIQRPYQMPKEYQLFDDKQQTFQMPTLLNQGNSRMPRAITKKSPTGIKDQFNIAAVGVNQYHSNPNQLYNPNAQQQMQPQPHTQPQNQIPEQDNPFMMRFQTLNLRDNLNQKDGSTSLYHSNSFSPQHQRPQQPQPLLHQQQQQQQQLPPAPMQSAFMQSILSGGASTQNLQQFNQSPNQYFNNNNNNNSIPRDEPGRQMKSMGQSQNSSIWNLPSTGIDFGYQNEQQRLFNSQQQFPVEISPLFPSMSNEPDPPTVPIRYYGHGHGLTWFPDIE